MELTLKKKLAGFAAAGVLALAMAPVAAFGAGALTKDGSISVTGLIDASDTAQYYQVVTQDPDTNAWKLTAGVDANNDGKIDGSNYTIDDLVIQNPNATDKEVITGDMANAIAAALTTNNASGAAMDKEGTTAKKEGVDAGLYMVVATPGDNNKNTVYKPIFVSADYSSTDGTNTYGPLEKDVSDYADDPAIFKASDLSVDKTAEEKDNAVGDTKPEGVGVGDTLKFTVTTPIVGYSKNFTNPVFKVTDTLTEGLTLKSGTVKVEVAGFTEGETIKKDTDYTVAESTSGYVVSFEKDFLYKVKSAQLVTITYEATVTSTAGAQVNQMDNTVKLNFSNAPSDTTGAGELTDKTRHYTFDIDGDVLGGSESTGGDPDKKRTEEIQKVFIESNETETPSTPATSYNGTNALEGAEFQLTDKTTNKIVEWTNNVRSGSADAANSKTKIVSDSYGSIVMKGLDEGTYELVETKAPQGYTPDPAKHTIVIAAEYVNDSDGNKILKSYTITIDGTNTSTYTVELDGDTPKELIGDEVGKITVDTQAITTLISNKKLGILPATGGDGIFFYVFVGAAIMALAVVLARRYRKSQALNAGIA